MPDDVLSIPRAFVEFGYVKEASWLVLEVCKRGNFGPETAPYQTYVLEITLQSTPDIAEALLAKNRLHHFDRHQISVSCEKVGLF